MEKTEKETELIYMQSNGKLSSYILESNFHTSVINMYAYPGKSTENKDYTNNVNTEVYIFDTVLEIYQSQTFHHLIFTANKLGIQATYSH